MTTHKVELQNVSKTFSGDGRQVQALAGLSLHADPGGGPTQEQVRG